MRAAILNGPQNITINEVPEPIYSENDVLVKVICCNICGSDVRTYRFGSDSIKSGTILGHEFVGEVIKAPAWSGLNTGDRVTAAQDIPCGECWYCRNAMIHVCENKLEFGKQYQGAFADKMVIPEIAIKKGWVKKLPDTMSTEAGSLVEPVSSCVHTQIISPTKPGDVIVIIGAGPIGCIHGELAKNTKAEAVIIADLSEDRLEIARKFNFTDYVCTKKEDLVAKIKTMYPKGVDKVISANPSPEAVTQGIEIARKRGTVVAFGGLPKNNYMVPVNGNKIHYDEIQLMGSYAYSPQENDIAFDYISSGAISVEHYISEVFTLDRIEEGMRAAIDAKAMKIQIRI